MRIRRTGAIASCTAATALVVTLSGAADAAVLCGAKDRVTGRLRDGASLHVRSVCRTNEVSADLAALGLSAQPHLTVRLGNTITTNVALSTLSACDPAEVATGGGVLATGASGGVVVVRSSRPDPDTEGSEPTGWRAAVANLDPTVGTVTATAYAVCAAP